jgi:hypothetical protein
VIKEISLIEDPDKVTAYSLDNDATPDNVLKYQIGELEDVTLVGRNKEGQLVYASSLDSPDDVLNRLKSFKRFLRKNKYV